MAHLPESLCALIGESSRRYPDHIAIADGSLRISYRDLGARQHAMARALIAAGVQHGDRVAIWLPNTWHWPVAALGAHAAGASIVPLNTRYTGHEAVSILRRTGARVLFLPGRFLGVDYLAALREAARAAAVPAPRPPGTAPSASGLPPPVPGLDELTLAVAVPVDGEGTQQADGKGPQPGAGVLAWDQLLARAKETSQEAARARAAQVTAGDIADIIFTSGTTGQPKGAMSEHRQTIAVAAAWAERAEVTDRDVYLIIAPFFHTFGYKAGWVVALLRGATIVPQMTFDVDRVLEVIERERVTLMPGPPTIFQALLEHPRRADYDLSSLRLSVTGAAMVPVALIERMRQELTFETILTAYGLTEAVVVTMCQRDDDPATISGTSGCAAAGFEIRIAGPGGKVLGPGEDGEIQVRGPNVMAGYLDDPEATRAAIDPDGWLHTGDVGHLDRRGYLTITDRLKDMFTVGGFNVYPAEVENVIMSLPGVIDCAVVGRPDQRLGEAGLAYVVTRRGSGLTEQDVIAHCRQRLANFKVPRDVVFLAELPRNAGGKVLKRELRERARREAGAAAAPQPGTVPGQGAGPG
jgi:acyl-CoA synthetase (AMP-forming)/AMP-acid ligase II